MNEVLRRMSSLALTTASRQRGPSIGLRSLQQRGIAALTQGRQLGSVTSIPSHSLVARDVIATTDLLRWQPRSQFSSKVRVVDDESLQISADELSPTDVSLITDAIGQQYGVLLDTRKLPKLKPSIVRRRLDRMKTYIGTEKGIRHSAWKINRICQLAAGLTLEEALTQLKFCDKKNADLVAKVLKRTSNLADMRDGLQMSQLEVAECFATKGIMLKRLKPMGRGRHGIMHHKFSHFRVVLREIDFKLKIYQQKSMNQKQKWLMHQARAKRDADKAMAEREEVQRLMKQQEEQKRERKSAEKK